VRVLTINVGSSNVKLRLLDEADNELWARTFDVGDRSSNPEAVHGFLVGAPSFDAIGHRLVHGGPRLRTGTLASDEVVAELRALGGLAPLHNEAALNLLEAAREALPDVPHVVCFDTAFHRTLPEDATVYPVPWRWTEAGMRRYGFHGLSFAYATGRAAELLGRPREELRIVICHLGSGASLAAVAGGVSVDTTMGLTPNEGLMMSTRSGSVDPGGLLWIMREQGLSPEKADLQLERHAGLLGVSGVSSDVRPVFEAADRGNERAQLALAIYLRRLRSGIAAMAAAMNGLDALVFTGGVGEHSARIRADACRGLGFLGVALDKNANENAKADSVVSPADAATAVVVVYSREDVGIAAEVREILVVAAEPGS
jgi:acetate kinase